MPGTKLVKVGGIYRRVPVKPREPSIVDIADNVSETISKIDSSQIGGAAVGKPLNEAVIKNGEVVISKPDPMSLQFTSRTVAERQKDVAESFRKAMKPKKTAMRSMKGGRVRLVFP